MPEVVIYTMTGQEVGSNGTGAGQKRRAFLTAWDPDTEIADLMLFPWLSDGYPQIATGIPLVAVPLYDIPRSIGIAPGCWTSN